MTSASGFVEPMDVEALISEKNWEQVISSTEALADGESCPSIFRVFRGKAFSELNKLAEAEIELRRGLAGNSNNRWARILLITVLINSGQDRQALSELQALFVGEDKDVEAAKGQFVELATSKGNFHLASQINETRSVIRDSFPRPKFAVAIQCFNKHDTLEAVFSALIKCRGSRDFGLVLVQDSALNSKKEAVYTPEVEKVAETISRWIPVLADHFNSVEFLKNPTNKGTAPTCRRLLDRVAQSYDGFLFIEDDCLLAEDALEWSCFHLENSISPLGYWFATCESIFFDSRSATPGVDQIAALGQIARSTSIRARYIDLDFVPSTCFITTTQIWNMCASVRSFTRGPESLNSFVAKYGHKTLFPLVPRASDIGMLHAFGYSVSVLGADKVKEIKNTYLQSEGPLRKDEICPYDGNRDVLFGASVRFHQPHINRLLSQLEDPSSAAS
jgi:hypothetical protein